TTIVGAANPGYDTEAQNNLMDEYSDLSYEQYQITAGGTYNFTEAFYTKASLTYDIFDMQEEFVYGDEDGTAYYGYVGVGWNF
ncbi:MAG: GSU2204 family outer membrane beta-barrel protein, partial [Desulfuromusa sp.]|nr:GSU2204 family outer membrane beta-barrel protein [Desulfuromusa sp.]